METTYYNSECRLVHVTIHYSLSEYASINSCNAVHKATSMCREVAAKLILKQYYNKFNQTSLELNWTKLYFIILY